MTIPDFVSCLRALHAIHGAPDASGAPSEEEWFRALLEEGV
jgi:hypothetical protein